MKKPNILIIGIDSLKSTNMSCYGYPRQTTPHIDKFAQSATLFENTFSAHIPTTSGYASMLTGRDCFGTEVVALRHQGPLTDKVRTLPEILREEGYASTCVGFTGNPASRGFDNYLNYEAWGAYPDRLRKAELLNDVTLPEMERLSATDEPWLMLLRHMDPHAPYLPPEPFDTLFYQADAFDPTNKSMEPVYSFKPFCDFHKSWLPPGVTDKEYVIAQYDGEIAYMDACIQSIFEKLDQLGIADDTIVVLNSDHGETLYDHECWFDHHGIYDVTLQVPLIIRYGRKLPAGKRVSGYNQQKHLVPTLLELAEVDVPDLFDGPSLMQLVTGEAESFESEFYITECTWMRKHGWRTPEWKLIVALEPDFHFKPPVELYNLVDDPEENANLVDKRPEVVADLTRRMEAFIVSREKALGITNPMLTQGDWHGHKGLGSFTSSEQAYNTMHIGGATEAKKLQAKSRGK